MRSTAVRWPRLPGLFGTGLGFGCAIVATIAAAAGGLVDPLSAPVLMVAIVSAVTTMVGAVLAGLQAWLLYASFIVGHTGQLALTAPSLQAAGVLAGAAVVATAAGGAIRWIQRPALGLASLIRPAPEPR
jgi:hypothetical protein